MQNSGDIHDRYDAYLDAWYADHENAFECGDHDDAPISIANRKFYVCTAGGEGFDPSLFEMPMDFEDFMVADDAAARYEAFDRKHEGIRT